MAESPVVSEKVCSYYLKPQGCVKGDKCDFKHVTNKVCEYYLKARGCNKGESCDFLHPNVQGDQRVALQAQIAQKNQPCTYYNSPRGCIKGAACDFMHPTSFMGGHLSLGPMLGSMGGYDGYGTGSKLGVVGMNRFAPSAQSSAAPPPKICQFFTTTRGCNKGNSCDWAHVPPQQFGFLAGTMTSAGPVSKMGKLLRPKVCEFFASERGCIKAESCEFIHQQQKSCEFFSSPRGCIKGKFCDFLHTAEPISPTASGVSATTIITSKSSAHGNPKPVSSNGTFGTTGVKTR
jgi:hypothetical protein